MENSPVLHLQNRYHCAVLVLPHIRSSRRSRKDVETATIVIDDKVQMSYQR